MPSCQNSDKASRIYQTHVLGYTQLASQNGDPRTWGVASSQTRCPSLPWSRRCEGNTQWPEKLESTGAWADRHLHGDLRWVLNVRLARRDTGETLPSLVKTL